MNNISKILKETGCEIDDIIKTTVWMSDARDFQDLIIHTQNTLKIINLQDQQLFVI